MHGVGEAVANRPPGEAKSSRCRRRWLAPAFIVAALVAAGAAAWWFTGGGGRVRASSSGNKLGNPPGMVDRLLFVDSADGWSAGALEQAEVVAACPAVVRLRD